MQRQKVGVVVESSFVAVVVVEDIGIAVAEEGHHTEAVAVGNHIAAAVAGVVLGRRSCTSLI